MFVICSGCTSRGAYQQSRLICNSALRKATFRPAIFGGCARRGLAGRLGLHATLNARNERTRSLTATTWISVRSDYCSAGAVDVGRDGKDFIYAHTALSSSSVIWPLLFHGMKFSRSCVPEGVTPVRRALMKSASDQARSSPPGVRLGARGEEGSPGLPPASCTP